MVNTKNQVEINVQAPWGKIAMATFGDPKNYPILILHGYLDTAATFLGLLEYLPDHYYYVAIDIPGHGLSDPFPGACNASQIHVVEVLRRVVEYMKWDQFIFLGHSMAYVIGLFYNAVFPNKISKMINLDPLPPIANFNSHLSIFKIWFYFHYETYYMNYVRWTSGVNPRSYTLDEAISIISSSRNVNADQAKLMLTRTLVPNGQGKYTFSWDPRMKKITDITCPRDMIYYLMSNNVPPTLSLISTIKSGLEENRPYGEKLLEEVNEALPHYFMMEVEGRHDVHCSNPERIAPLVIDFLNKNVVVQAKL